MIILLSKFLILLLWSLLISLYNRKNTNVITRLALYVFQKIHTEL